MRLWTHNPEIKIRISVVKKIILVKILYFQISSQNKQHSRTLKLRNDAYSKLKSQVSHIDMICLERVIGDNSERVITKVKMTHSKKLNNLGIFNSLKPLDPSRVIFNYSNYVLSHKESNLLTLGLNFIYLLQR